MDRRSQREEESLTEMEAVGRALTAGPKCRVCGFPMEPGFLRVGSGQPLATFLAWCDPSDREGVPGGEVERLPWGDFPTYHALAGYRCPECHRLDLGYGRRGPAGGAPTE